MRTNCIVFFIISMIALAGCSGSDTYLGEWKATSISGDKYTIFFKPKSLSIKRVTGDSLNFEYTQNAVKIENSLKTYGITLSNGKAYNIFFPFPNDLSKCLITVENDKPLYILSRTSYLSQEKFYSLTK